MDFLLATSNPGKIQELRELLAPLEAPSPLTGLIEFSVTLRTVADFPDVPDVPESEPTFEANAIAKAKYYAERTGLPTIADDGGLEIDALGGWPGVHSRRLFGDDRRATDDEMIAEVLRRMAGIPPDRRGCQMRTVVAFGQPDGTMFHAEALDRGAVAEHASVRPRLPGFPFRSIFFHPEAGGTIVNVLARKPKAVVMTHRRDAVAALLPKLMAYVGSHAHP